MKLAAMDSGCEGVFAILCMLHLQHQLGQQLVLPQDMPVWQVNLDDWSK